MVTGVVNSAVMNGIVDLFETSKIPLVGSNASPTTLTDATYIWRTSYVNDEPGEALGAYVAENVDGGVYFLAADYQAGKDEVSGFKKTFEPAGGEVVDEVYTPFPGTTNFQPFLANAKSSGAEALFSFYAGGAAVEFVAEAAKRRIPVLVDGERSVGELNARLDLSQSALSQHLALLRQDGLVATRREAQTVFYSLAPGPAGQILETLHGIYCAPRR